MYTPPRCDEKNVPEVQENEILSGPTKRNAPAHAKVLSDVFDALVVCDSWVTDRSRQEAAQRLSELTPQVRDYGSDYVLGAFRRLCEATDAYASAPSLYKLGDHFQALEDLLLAVRIDRGHGGQGLECEDGLGLFVSDIGEYLAQSRIPDRMA